MVMLSELRRFRLRDERHAEAALIDLSLDLASEAYPRVTGLLFHRSRKHLRLPDRNGGNKKRGSHGGPSPVETTLLLSTRRGCAIAHALIEFLQKRPQFREQPGKNGI